MSWFILKNFPAVDLEFRYKPQIDIHFLHCSIFCYREKILLTYTFIAAAYL